MHNFSDIEDKRERLGIAQKDLCARADVNASTYSRAKATDREPTARTRRKLLAALIEISSERGVSIADEGRP